LIPGLSDRRAYRDPSIEVAQRLGLLLALLVGHVKQWTSDACPAVLRFIKKYEVRPFAVGQKPASKGESFSKRLAISAKKAAPNRVDRIKQSTGSAS
jgi:hypothetical protein